MFQKQIKITAPLGIHLRPAAQLVKEAQLFDADIKICVNDKCANAKSLFNLQSLDLTLGNVVTISATGKQAKQAVEYLEQVLLTLK